MLDDSKQPYKLSINSVFPTLLHRTKVVSTVLVTLHGINTETLHSCDVYEHPEVGATVIPQCFMLKTQHININKNRTTFSETL